MCTIVKRKGNMKNLFAAGLSAAIAVAISGCATSPEKIQDVTKPAEESNKPADPPKI